MNERFTRTNQTTGYREHSLGESIWKVPRVIGLCSIVLVDIKSDGAFCHATYWKM